MKQKMQIQVTQKPQLHQDWIDPHAFGIVRALQKGGFETYLVGGCVRDLLLGIHPKDFDIATQAHPPQVKKLIHMAYIIGKRFRLVLVKRDEQQFEVATFRREAAPEDMENEGDAPTGDNFFGTPEEDARRRDFTINALFYDPVKEQLIDYVDGLSDVRARIIRVIGEPDVRLREDPIRILRALRLAHKLDCTLDADLRSSMVRNADELVNSVLPRRREEILKILRLQDPAACLLEAYDLGLLASLLPGLHELFEQSEKRELFLQHFSHFQKVIPTQADPSFLFAWIIFSIFESVIGLENIDAKFDLQEDERFLRLMRDEMGMHKFEQSKVASALQLLPNLKRVEDYRKRGERRQFAFLKSEGFELAFSLSISEFLLNPSEVQFWQNAFIKMQPELIADAEDKRARKKRPRRRKPRQSGNSARNNQGHEESLSSNSPSHPDGSDIS